MIEGISVDIEHGTRNGYNACRRRPEGPCEPCRVASAEYMRDYRAGRGMARNRAQTTAYARALAVLRVRHQAEFDALYADELKRVGIEVER